MTFGEALAARRGEWGLTIQQVSSTIRIGPEQLRALEARELDAFAAPVYAAGDLRTYALYLGLEGEVLAAELKLHTAAGARLEVESGLRAPRLVLSGSPQYGTSGRALPAGSIVCFTGARVQISSGNAAAPQVTVDGRPAGAMGAGLATRDYTSQTSTQ